MRWQPGASTASASVDHHGLAVCLNDTLFNDNVQLDASDASFINPPRPSLSSCWTLHVGRQYPEQVQHLAAVQNQELFGRVDHPAVPEEVLCRDMLRNLVDRFPNQPTCKALNMSAPQIVSIGMNGIFHE